MNFSCFLIFFSMPTTKFKTTCMTPIIFLLEGVDHDPSPGRLLMYQLEGRKCSLVVSGAPFKPKAVLRSGDHRQHPGCSPCPHDSTASSSVPPHGNQDTEQASHECCWWSHRFLMSPASSHRGGNQGSFFERRGN